MNGAVLIKWWRQIMVLTGLQELILCGWLGVSYIYLISISHSWLPSTPDESIHSTGRSSQMEAPEGWNRMKQKTWCVAGCVNPGGVTGATKTPPGGWLMFVTWKGAAQLVGMSRHKYGDLPLHQPVLFCFLFTFPLIYSLALAAIPELTTSLYHNILPPPSQSLFSS